MSLTTLIPADPGRFAEFPIVLAAMVVFGVVALPFTAIWTVALSLPLHVLLSWLGRREAISYMAAGTIGGAGLALVGGALAPPTAGTLQLAAAFALAGLTAALTFWLVRRPDFTRPAASSGST